MTARGLLIAFLVAPFLICCGSRTGQLCERAAECNIIKDSDIDACHVDLDRALSQGEIMTSEVKDCHACVEESTCEAGALSQCALACESVAPYIYASKAK